MLGLRVEMEGERDSSRTKPYGYGTHIHLMVLAALVAGLCIEVQNIETQYIYSPT